MRCAAAASTLPSTPAAVRHVIDHLGSGGRADLAVAFASSHHAGALALLAEELHTRQLSTHFLGVTGQAVVAIDREIEQGPALALWTIRLPAGASVHSLRLTGKPDAAQFQPLQAHLGSPGTLILLADPFTFPTDRWLELLREVAPGWQVVGGMASAGQEPGVNRLGLDGEIHDDGAVALLLEGPIRVRTIVSQGCRPIGEPLVITRADRNRIQQFGGRPALARLQQIFDELDPEDQNRARQGLHLGRVINEYQEHFGRGDFLVRNVAGVDESGAVAVGDLVRVGQTVQFHVRDAQSADADLRELLAEALAAEPSPERIIGALLFTCNGRGTNLFDEPHHDVTAIRDAAGPIPVAGFFAMGEIGPIGGQSFVHGFTASIVLFGDDSSTEQPG